MSDYTTLEVFDFDWTMFRSPLPPEGKPEKSWWASRESLSPPYVPLRATRDFWIEEVVREAKASQRRPSILTIVLTARRAKAAPRIHELLEQRDIEPQMFLCRSATFQKDRSATLFKRKSIVKILDEHPEIKKVVVWEDTPEQLSGIGALVKKRRLSFEGNLVTDPEYRGERR